MIVDIIANTSSKTWVITTSHNVNYLYKFIQLSHYDIKLAHASDTSVL